MRVSLALLVFFFHSMIHFNCSYSILSDFFRMGAIAMTGFFMLSGYSMHLSSSRKDFTKLHEVKIFYLKRIITILPLYFTVALIRVIYEVIVGKSTIEEILILFPVELTVTQSTFTNSLFTFSHNAGTWFISCILFCYLVYPYLQSLFLQMSVKTKMFVLLFFCGLLFYAPFVQHYLDLDNFSIYTSPFYRLMEFCIGVIIAQFNTANCEDNSKLFYLIRKPYSMVASLVLLISLVTLGRKMGVPSNYMMFNIIAVPCFVCMIISLGSMKCNYLFGKRTLLYLSSISFTFFLCQTLPLWKVSGYFYNIIAGESNILRVLLSFTICITGAMIIHHVVEKPISSYLKFKFL